MKRNLVRHLVRYSLLGMMTIITVGCDDGSLTTVSGTITDEVGVPVVAAVVSAVEGDDTDITDNDGNFSVEVPVDSLDITVTSDDFVELRVRAHRRYRGGAHFQMDDGNSTPCLRMDTDGDGAVSVDEWTGPSDVFVTIDNNGDGVLSSEELIAGREQHRQQRQQHGMAGRMDADGNGVITSDEWLGNSGRFATLDSDGNGEISEAEMSLAWQSRRR